jgi:hypothetical protein
MSEIVLRLDPAAVPVWAWIAAGAVLWYAFAAVVIWFLSKPSRLGPLNDEADVFGVLLFSPIWVPVVAVITPLVGFCRVIGRLNNDE